MTSGVSQRALNCLPDALPRQPPDYRLYAFLGTNPEYAIRSVRWAVNPIISRNRSASALFSRSVRRVIISSVIAKTDRANPFLWKPGWVRCRTGTIILGAPQWVLDAHLADQATNFQRDGRSTTTASRLPAPIQSKSGAVPADDRVRPDICQSIVHP